MSPLGIKFSGAFSGAFFWGFCGFFMEFLDRPRNLLPASQHTNINHKVYVEDKIILTYLKILEMFFYGSDK